MASDVDVLKVELVEGVLLVVDMWEVEGEEDVAELSVSLAD